MGLVYADIKLVNSGDITLARNNYIKETEIKSITVKMLVDSGAYMLTINENIKNQLGLPVIGNQEAKLADDSIIKFEVVGPVEVIFKNRSTSTRAAVLPGSTEPLLGAIPMEDLDVMIDPKSQELILPPDRPYMAQKLMKKINFYEI